MTTEKITPKNWDTFQHYKDRKPSWIKLHRSILDDYVFACLPVASRALAPLMWLLASEYDDGEITASIDEIAFRFRMSPASVEEALAPLIDKEMFAFDPPRIKVLAERKQTSIPEREEETEKQEQKEGERAPPAASPAASGNSKSKQAKLPLVEKKKATRIDPEWKLSHKNSDDARACGLSEVQMAKEARAFKDWWLAKSGKDATKMDWDATWRTWCQRTADRMGIQRPAEKLQFAAPVVFTEAQWMQILKIYAGNSNWNPAYGPAPGKPGCKVPKHLTGDDEPELV